jgi:hypothetical protein
MVWFPLLRLEEVVAFARCAAAAIVTAGRLAATAMLALAVKNLRRDVTSSVEVISSLTGSSSACGQDVLVTLGHPVAYVVGNNVTELRAGAEVFIGPSAGRQLSFDTARNHRRGAVTVSRLRSAGGK